MLLSVSVEVGRKDPSMEWKPVVERATRFLFMTELLRGMYFTLAVCSKYRRL